MTNKDKKLLLNDLAKRLGNDVKMRDNRGHIGTLKIIDFIHNTIGFKTTNIYGKDSILIKGKIDCWKPYLRPISSMTEEENKELSKLLNYEFYIDQDFALRAEDDRHRIRLDLITVYTDFLNSHHFDYRGLIEKGLALEAPEDMYK